MNGTGPFDARRSVAPTPTVAGTRPMCTSSVGLHRRKTRTRRFLMRAAIYARVSTPRQARESNTDQQVARLERYAERQGWVLDGGHVYLDEGHSGARLSRPGLDALRDAAAMAEFEVLLVAAPDRLARNYVHQVLLLEELQGRGCRVEFAERPMSQDPNDQLLLQIRGAVAEYERTLIAERMRRGRLAKLRSGQLLPWLRVPFGYRTDPERPRDPAGLRVEEYEAAIVRQMFAWYLEQGATLGTIARRLTEGGVLTPTGKRSWSRSTIRGILKNHATWGTPTATAPTWRRRRAEDRRLRPWAGASPPSGARKRSGSPSRSPRSSRGRLSTWSKGSSPTTANSPRATTRATATS
jgi:site-specific DNA recombinase